MDIDEEEVLIDIPEDEEELDDEGLPIDDDLGLGLEDELDDDLEDLGIVETFGEEDDR
jgi:hypothetical protein